MYQIIAALVTTMMLVPTHLMLGQQPIYEKLHGAEIAWWVDDAQNNTVNLLDGMQPGQILVVMPVNREDGAFLNELSPFEEVLSTLGSGGTESLSMALIEVSGHDLNSDSWSGGTTLPVYSGQTATLTSTSYSTNSPNNWYSTIQMLSNGTLIESHRSTNPLLPGDWWTVPLFTLLYQSNTYFTIDDNQPSFLTSGAGGFPDFEALWCDAVGCDGEDFEEYNLGAGASESNPGRWRPYGGLVGTSQDGTVVIDPTNPQNKVLQLKTDSINGDVGFANKHIHAFEEYEIDFDILRREGKGFAFIGTQGEFGSPTTLIGDGLNYTEYFGRLSATEDGRISAYFWESIGVGELEPEVWHHVRIQHSPFKGFIIEVNGETVWSLFNNDRRDAPKFSAMNFWARSITDSEFLIDNVNIKPVYRRNAGDFLGGCSNPNACNFNFTLPSDYCEFPSPGTDCNGDCLQDSNADGICDDVVGCTDPSHPLYDPSATEAEECCTILEYVSSSFAQINTTERILRQSAWSLSRIVVVDSLGNNLFDSDDFGMVEFQADDKWLFQRAGENNFNYVGMFDPTAFNSTTTGSLVYENNYVTQNHLLGYAPEFGTYQAMGGWSTNIPAACEIGLEQLRISDFYFCPDVDVFPPLAEVRPGFLGVTDAQGYDCGGYSPYVVIETINDSLLTIRSPLADNATEGAQGLISFKAVPHEFSFCILGCTDPGACNYESYATYDDGTCTHLCRSGCTDSNAQNYDLNAEIDDGSCEYICGFANNFQVSSAYATYTEPGLISADTARLSLGVEESAQNAIVVPFNYTNTAGSAFPIASFTPTSISGLPPGIFPSTFPSNVALDPQPAACISLEGTPTAVGVYNVVVEGDLSVFFGSNEQDFGSFQYNWIVEVTQGAEPVLGCTYPDASNYVSYANDDDGSCLFSVIPNPCPADFDENGQVGTPDLLEFLAYFGTVCE